MVGGGHSPRWAEEPEKIKIIIAIELGFMFMNMKYRAFHNVFPRL
jgi:hypothetical protein